jgi:hypothetical protein
LIEDICIMHPIYRITACTIAGPFQLQLRFDDGLERTIDLQPILKGAIYGPLSDISVFNQVRIDPEVHTVVWPNGADFDPATLHDWPKHEAIWRKKAAEWEQVKT